MEIRLRPILFILYLAATASAAAAIGTLRPEIDPLAFRTLAAPTAPPAVTQTLTSQLITLADDSAAWDWHVTCQDALATWVRQSPNPIRTIRVTLTGIQNLVPLSYVPQTGPRYQRGRFALSQHPMLSSMTSENTEMMMLVAIRPG